jgi:hypothetical protein
MPGRCWRLLIGCASSQMSCPASSRAGAGVDALPTLSVVTLRLLLVLLVWQQLQHDAGKRLGCAGCWWTQTCAGCTLVLHLLQVTCTSNAGSGEHVSRRRPLLFLARLRACQTQALCLSDSAVNVYTHLKCGHSAVRIYRTQYSLYGIYGHHKH